MGAEAAGAAEAVKSVVDYCTAHYGMLSFGSGDTLKLIQSRVTGGGYDLTGWYDKDESAGGRIRVIIAR